MPIQRDIFFVVDGSSSIQKENFKTVRAFLKKFAASIRISANEHHIGLLQFSERSVIELPLGQYSEEKVLEKIAEMKYHVGLSTNTGTALKTVVDEV